MAQDDPPTATRESSQITQNPKFHGLQQQVNDIKKQISTIIALLSSRAANTPAPNGAAPPTPLHLDVHDQLPPGCVYTTDPQFSAQAQTSSLAQAGNPPTTTNNATAPPVIMVNKRADHHLEEERSRKDEEMSLLTQ